MNNLSIEQPSLPAHLQRELDRQRNHMTRIAQLTVQALDEESNLYSYAVYKTISSLSTTNLLKKAAKADGLPTKEIEEYYREITENFMKEMTRIPQEACEKIIQMLQNIPTEPEDGGLIEEALDIFNRLITK